MSSGQGAHRAGSWKRRIEWCRTQRRVFFFVQSNLLPSTGSQALSITLPEPSLIASCIIVKLNSIVLNTMELVSPNASAKKEKYH